MTPDDLTVRTIRENIVSILEGVTYNGKTAFAATYPYPTLNFTGLPAATVSPTQAPNDYLMNVINLRTYVFSVDLFISIEDQQGGPSKAWPAMEVIWANVIYALDNSNSLNGSAQIVQPVPSTWQPMQSSMGEVLNASLTVRCKITYPTNNG